MAGQSECDGVLVIGSGYLGRQLGQLIRRKGCRACLTTRSAQKAERLRAQGFDVVQVDVTDPDSLRRLPGFSQVIYAVGFDRRGAKTRQEVLVDGLQRVLEQSQATVRRFVFISTTGVYGQRGGQWVDESSVCQPVREAGKMALAAEQRLRADPLGDRSVVLRMAGIYGPGRLPYLADLKAGRPLQVPRAGYLNLVHVRDAAQITLEALRRIDGPELLVVSDGQPVLREAFYRYLGRHVGVTVEFASRNASPDDRADAAVRFARAGSSKRIDTRRLRSLLDPQLEFPSYREGLPDALVEASEEGL